MIKIAIIGGHGRMGTAVAECAKKSGDFQVVALIGRNDDPKASVDQCDVVVDFSNPTATIQALTIATVKAKPCVIGTTGFSPEQERRIKEISEQIAIVKAANFSLGVNILFTLCAKAAEKLGPSYDAEIIEIHHRQKKDAPSGTAIALGRVIANARNAVFQEVAKHGRSGVIGPRQPTEIGIHAVRAGDVFGDHTVLFATEGERIEMIHRASNRTCFADGALCAANWVVGKLPGLYTMSNVLQLE